MDRLGLRACCLAATKGRQKEGEETERKGKGKGKGKKESHITNQGQLSKADPPMPAVI